MRAGDDTSSLPEDPAALRALLLAALQTCDTLSVERNGLVAERDALAARNERLHHLLLKLKRRQFGRKSEQLPEDQLLFAFEEIEATLAGSEAEAVKRSPKLGEQQAKRRRGNRGRLPAHLPRIEQVLLPDSTTCPCCRGALVEIGVDTSERLDVLAAQFRVLVTKRPKLACRGCAGVVLQAPAPARLITGGLPTEATVAQVLVARYADHLPFCDRAFLVKHFRPNEQGHASVRGRLGRQHDAYSGRQTAPKLYHVLRATRADTSSSHLRPCSGPRAAARPGGQSGVRSQCLCRRHAFHADGGMAERLSGLPHAQQHDRELARDGDTRLLSAGPAHEPDTPAFQGGPLAYPAKQGRCGLIENSTNTRITGSRNPSNMIGAAGLIAAWRQAEPRTHVLRPGEPGRIIHSTFKCERDDGSDTRRRHQHAHHRIGFGSVEQLLFQGAQLLQDDLAHSQQSIDHHF